MKVNLISLGCSKNLVDSEKMLAALGASGLEICAVPESSDAIIINTCAFIEPAIRETEQVISQVLLHNKGNPVYVYGCAVNRYKNRLKKTFPRITGLFTLEEQDKLLGLFDKKARISRTRFVLTRGYAYLKIADGCSNHCSYCTIPRIKGAFKSNTMDDLYKEAVELARFGIKELILIAQDTTAYGKDLYNKPMLASLLRKLSQIKDIEWIRIMYAHPKHLTDDIIDEIKSNEKVCKYLDLPLQHINDRILNMMDRGITKSQTYKVMAKLKNIKDISIRTTVIAGFADETDDEFMELLNFIKDIGIDWLGVFPYYPEPGTRAADLAHLPDNIIEQRYSGLLDLQQEIMQKGNLKRINKTYKTLIHYKNKVFKGHTEHLCPEIDSEVIIDPEDLKLGKFYQVRFTDISGCDINARIVK
jgi:ribosomal protein S12 methylthiotransferase